MQRGVGPPPHRICKIKSKKKKKNMYTVSSFSIFSNLYQAAYISISNSLMLQKLL